MSKAKITRCQTAAQDYTHAASDKDPASGMYAKSKRWWVQTLNLYRMCRPFGHPVIKNAEKAIEKIDQVLSMQRSNRVS